MFPKQCTLIGYYTHKTTLRVISKFGGKRVGWFTPCHSMSPQFTSIHSNSLHLTPIHSVSRQLTPIQWKITGNEWKSITINGNAWKLTKISENHGDQRKQRKSTKIDQNQAKNVQIHESTKKASSENLIPSNGIPASSRTRTASLAHTNEAKTKTFPGLGVESHWNTSTHPQPPI